MEKNFPILGMIDFLQVDRQKVLYEERQRQIKKETERMEKMTEMVTRNKIGID